MKASRNVRPKNIKLSELVEGFESKGIEVNKESLRTRSKSRRSIGDLEGAADALHKKIADQSDSDEDVIKDKDMADQEQEGRGRKRRRNRSIDSADYMDVD